MSTILEAVIIIGFAGHFRSPKHLNLTIRRRKRVLDYKMISFSHVFILSALACLTATNAQVPHLELSLLSTYATGIFNKGASEIPKYDPCTKKVFSTNSDAKRVDVLDMSNGGMLQFITSVSLLPYGIDPNSVAVNHHLGYFAVSGTNITNGTMPGSVVFFNTSDYTYLGLVVVGAVPDMVKFANGGRTLLVANEGESAGASDPEGSVGIIKNIAFNPFSYVSTTVGFTQYNGQEDALRAQGIRIFPGIAASFDFEPEYIAVYGDLAYVTLQENNAVAVISISQERIVQLLPLGVTNHSLSGFGLDTNDRDGKATIVNQPNLYGLRMPDTIATYKPTRGRSHYFVTANEGDSRSEAKRISTLTLDPVAFPNAVVIKSDASMGRLEASNIDGKNPDGTYSKLYSYGSRSFSIFSPKGELLFDSGDAFENITAATFGGYFNSNSDSNASNDTRSDNKGPEPEALAVGYINGFSYAFIGLERMGGIMVREMT